MANPAVADDFSLSMERIGRRLAFTIAALESGDDGLRQQCVDELHDLKTELEEAARVAASWPRAGGGSRIVDLEDG